jgi:hypothetical protein
MRELASDLQLQIIIALPCLSVFISGLYIGKSPPPPWGISADVVWEKKYEKGKRKGGKCKRKMKKGRRNKEKMGSKKVIKKMQNREELRQKGHDRSIKTTCCKKGKNIILERGPKDRSQVPVIVYIDCTLLCCIIT